MATNKVTAEGLRQRREAMRSMVEIGSAMIKAHEDHGDLDLPERYNLIARQVQEFFEWRRSQEFKVEPRTLEELV
jgi:hypothetical protein